MTSPNDPPVGRPTSFDEWLQAFKEQASFFTGLKLNVGAPRWQLADELPVLPIVWYEHSAAINPAVANVSVDPLEISYRITAMRWAG